MKGIKKICETILKNKSLKIMKTLKKLLRYFKSLTELYRIVFFNLSFYNLAMGKGGSCSPEKDSTIVLALAYV